MGPLFPGCRELIFQFAFKRARCDWEAQKNIVATERKAIE